MTQRPAALLLVCTLVGACASTHPGPGAETADPPAPPPPALPVEVWLEVLSGPAQEVPRAEVAIMVKQGTQTRRHLVDELPGGLDACRVDDQGGRKALVVSTSLGLDRWILEARQMADMAGMAVVERTVSIFQGQPQVEELDSVPLPAGVRVDLRPCARVASRQGPRG